MNGTHVFGRNSVIKLVFVIAFCVALMCLSGCSSKDSKEDISASDNPVNTDEGISASGNPVSADGGIPTSDNPVSMDEGISTSDNPVSADEGISNSDNPVNTDVSFPKVENQHYSDALIFMDAQQYKKAEDELLLAIDELKAQGLPDGDMQIAVVENKLGALYLKLEKYKDSYDHLMGAYISFRDHYGENAERTLLAKTGICHYDLAVGNYDLAISTLKDIHEQVSSVDGKVQTATLLGTTYMNQGDYESAESWYQKALSLENQLEDYDLSDLYNNIGVLYMHAGNWEKSLEFLQTAKQEAQGRGNSLLSQILYNIAQVYTNSGDWASANETINDMIARDILKYGAQSSFVAYDYLDASYIYKMMYDWDNQFRCIATAIKILTEIEGENSHILSVLYGELGGYYYKLGNSRLAISCTEKSIEIKKNILEEQSNGTMIAYANLGLFLLDAKDYQAAYDAYQHEHEIAVCLFGEDDLRTGEALTDLANASMCLGDLVTAERYAKESIDILLKNQIETGTAAGTAYDIMGQIYAANGQNDLAKSAWYKAVDIFEESAPMESILVNIYRQIGDLYLDMEDYAEAKENFTHALAKIIEIYRYQTESMLYVNNLAGSYNQVGFCAFKLEEYDEALRYYFQGEELLTGYLDGNQSIGSDDSKRLYRQLAIIYNNIASAYENLEEKDNAIKYALLSYQIVTEKELNLDDFQKLLQRMERLGIAEGKKPAADDFKKEEGEVNNDHEPDSEMVVIETELPDKDEIRELLLLYLEAVKNADAQQLIDIMAMDFASVTAVSLGNYFGKTVSMDALLDMYKTLYQKELVAFTAELVRNYGKKYSINCLVNNHTDISAEDIEETNKALKELLGDGAPEIEGFLTINLEFTIIDRESRKQPINRGFLNDNLPLYKIGGKWKLGTSDGFPKPSRELFLSVLQD